MVNYSTRFGRATSLVLLMFLLTVNFLGNARADTAANEEKDMARAFTEMREQGSFPVYDTLQLDSLVNAKMAQYHIPGLAVCIFMDSTIVMTRNYGWADVERAIPVSDTTLFLSGSISKTFVANAAMQMSENGYLDLDADINDYIPFVVSNPTWPDSIITMRSILSHTSSIDRRDWTWEPDIVWGYDHLSSLGQYLEDYLDPEGANYSPWNYLTSPPGRVFEYSNYAFSLAGYILEQMAISNGIAASLEQYCHDSLWEPLGMDETSWFLTNLDTNNIAVQYDYSGGYVRLGFISLPLYPAGQLRASSIQLARHAMAFMNYGELNGERILDSATVELMRTSQYPGVPTDDPDAYIYGMGWCKYIDPVDDWQYWGHSGGIQGCKTFMAFEPDERSGFVSLSNRADNAGFMELVYALIGFIGEADMDGVVAGLDNCPETYNPTQIDSDYDMIGDACDECTDSDADGFGDPGFVANTCADDNCPDTFNPDQDDLNGNETGDACEGCCGFWTSGITGNANCSEDGKLTLSDISRLIDRVYISKTVLCCEASGNTNADAECKITLSDITRLIDAVYISKADPEDCMPECEQ